MAPDAIVYFLLAGLGPKFNWLASVWAYLILLGTILLLGVVAVFALGRQVQKQHAGKVEVLSLYWHFVDAVWVVVFTVVYVIGR